MHTIDAYYYYVNDSPIGNIVFYATDNQNAEDKFRRLVQRKLQSNSYINIDKYRIEKYPYNKLSHSDYQMITRLPEKIKSVTINILNDPASRNDQSGWYVLWQNNKVIAQDFFKDRVNAIKSFTNNSCLENDCEQYLLHKQYTVTGPFKSGVKMNIKPTKKSSEPTLFEIKNIIKEENNTIVKLLTEQKKYNMNYKISSGITFKHEDKDKIVATDKIKIIVSYPLEKDKAFEIKAKKFTLENVVNCVIKVYEKIYASPEKYKVYGHGIGDLYLESIQIQNDGTVTLNVGS